MQKLFLFIVSIISFLGAPAATPPTEPIHIFTHELIYNTQKAYSPKNPVRNCFDKDHLTTLEFSRLLNELYQNNFILVNLTDFLDFNNLSEKTPAIPKGKKPFTLSFDDMTYDTNNLGVISKIILDENGQLADFTKSESTQLSYSRENITILENFIKENPDFSFNNARASICLNGYYGILGYKVIPLKEHPEDFRLNEVEECEKVVSKLIQSGYTFACHSFYHKFLANVTPEFMEKDLKMWEKYIQPIVGKTQVFCFPGGSHNLTNGVVPIIKKAGYNIFLCVGQKPTQKELEDTSSKFIYRKPIDGTSLRLYRNEYLNFVDTKKLYDTSRFRPFSYKGGY